jgi:putative membrane protein
MKIIIHWLVSAISIMVAAYLLPGVHVTGIVPALILAIVLGIVNTFVRPLLVLLTLPISILTLGLFTLVINAVLIMLSTKLVTGVSIDGFLWALAFGVVLAVVHAFLRRLER